MITGVAFLGAGTIIRRRDSVTGITTGASIWLAGAIGLSCGAGYYGIALAILVLTLFALAALGPLERKIPGKRDRRPDGG